MTEEDKKEEAEGVEKRAISKITQMLARRLCLVAGYSKRLIGVGGGEVTFALVLFTSIDILLESLSEKKKG